MADDSSFRVKNTLVVNNSFVANSTVVNAAAITATTIAVGNVGINATVVAVGANITVNNTTLALGNSSVYTNTVAGQITISGTVVNSTIYQGTSFNANNLGGASLSTIQGQITGNAAVAYSNAVANAAALYQTTAGLAANVATLTANAAGFLGNSSGSLANVASWVTGNAATAYSNAINVSKDASNITEGTLPNARLGASVVNTSGAFTISGVHTHSANIVMGGATITFTSGSINSTSFSTGTNTATIGTSGYFVSNGNFGVGNSAPTVRLQVQGAILASDNITAYSDARLKENINTIDSALSLVMQLRGVRYNKKDSGATSIGVVAQEVQPFVPEVVQDNGEYLSVAYGNLVGLLIEAIKELTAKVEELENKVK